MYDTDEAKYDLVRDLSNSSNGTGPIHYSIYAGSQWGYLKLSEKYLKESAKWFLYQIC